jgi:hypothetical protein
MAGTGGQPLVQVRVSEARTMQRDWRWSSWLSVGAADGDRRQDNQTSAHDPKACCG